MTYKLIEPNASGTGLYFQSGNEDLPMDKLQSFWQLRNASSEEVVSRDLLGQVGLRPTGSSPTNAVAWAPSNPCGGALGSSDFSQSNNTYYESVGDPTDYCGENRSLKWWMGAWFYPVTGTSADVVLAHASSTTAGWFLNIDAASSDHLGFYCNNGAGTWVPALSGNAVNFDAWNFGIFGHDGTVGFVSLNGATAVTTTMALPAAASTWGLTFGSWLYGAGSTDFDGYIADASYWVGVSANATATEIAALYNNGKGNTLLGG